MEMRSEKKRDQVVQDCGSYAERKREPLSSFEQRNGSCCQRIALTHINSKNVSLKYIYTYICKLLLRLLVKVADISFTVNFL